MYEVSGTKKVHLIQSFDEPCSVIWTWRLCLLFWCAGLLGTRIVTFQFRGVHKFIYQRMLRVIEVFCPADYVVTTDRLMKSASGVVQVLGQSPSPSGVVGQDCLE